MSFRDDHEAEGSDNLEPERQGPEREDEVTESEPTTTASIDELKRQIEEDRAEKMRMEGELRQELERMRGDRDRAIVEVDQLKRNNTAMSTSYETQLCKLEEERTRLVEEITDIKDQMEQREQQTNEAMRQMETELTAKLKELTLKYEGTVKERDALSRHLIQGEIEKKDAIMSKDKSDKKSKETVKELEKLQGRMKGFQLEVAKWQTTAESSEKAGAEMKKELKKYEEELSSQKIKVQWAQNKLKTETEAHKDTKAKLATTTSKLQATKEEAEQIRTDCQRMIKKYQESEEMKSVSLDQELKKKQGELKQQEQELSDQHEIKMKELDSLKVTQKDLLQCTEEQKTKIKQLEEQCSAQMIAIDELKTERNRKQTEVMELTQERDMLLKAKEDLQKSEDEVVRLKSEVSSHVSSRHELQTELTSNQDKAVELLAHSEKMATRNAELQSEMSALEIKVAAMINETERLNEENRWLEQQIEGLTSQFGVEKEKLKDEVGDLTLKLADKTLAVERLSLMLDEERNEVKVLKKKHAAGVKDLTRQLQQSKKRLEVLEGEQSRLSHNPSGPGSRSSSTGSLDGPLANGAVNYTDVLAGAPSVAVMQPGMLHDLDSEKTLLVDRICSLQQLHAKKDDKMEFFEGHVHQLTQEIKRKTKIIQSYILREEAGTLSPAVMDAVKVQRSRKGGIMASVFSSKQADGGMTLDLALEISSKMQAVLEDTLLKNMTLKENIETLANEIDRLNKLVRRQNSNHS